MTTLIAVLALLALAFSAYLVNSRLLGDRPTHNPVLDDLARDLDVERDPPAEAREGELAHQVLTGRIDSATYRREMSQLAHATAA